LTIDKQAALQLASNVFWFSWETAMKNKSGDFLLASTGLFYDDII